jgi:hypothetical protein
VPLPLNPKLVPVICTAEEARLGIRCGKAKTALQCGAILPLGTEFIAALIGGHSLGLRAALQPVPSAHTR